MLAKPELLNNPAALLRGAGKTSQLRPLAVALAAAHSPEVLFGQARTSSAELARHHSLPPCRHAPHRAPAPAHLAATPHTLPPPLRVLDFPRKAVAGVSGVKEVKGY